jgi:hypothetical protein
MKRLILFTSLLLVGTSISAAAAQLPPGGTFIDDNGNVHEANIESIAAAGITRGCNPPINDRFCPDESVTRGQMAAFLGRALELPSASTGYFSDTDGSVFQLDIDALAAAGITKGCNPPANDRFCPDESVTRGQMAAFLVRALDLPETSSDYFIDDDGSVFEGSINQLRGAGITYGCNPPANDMFCPDRDVRRDEMASLLARALDLDAEIPPPVNAACVRSPSESDPIREIIVAPGDDLAGALAAAQPGDRIVLQAGTYVQTGNLLIDASGTPTDWIQIVAAAGVTPVIDLNGAGEFRISGSYVSLDGVDIRNGGGNNLHIAPGEEDVHHVHVSNTTIHDLAWGPGAAVKINRNNSESAAVGTICLENNDVSEAIDNAIIDGVGVDGAFVTGNDIHDNAVGSHGIFFKGGSVDIVIESNVIRGISGNAALQLGGNTGASFWNPDYPGWEGVNQIARNNLIADFDDSAVEIRGVDGAFVCNNTIVGQTGFAVFRLQTGNNASGGASGNDDVHISSNLIIGTGGDPQYARNDAGEASITFGPQLWAGLFHNSGSATPGIPLFPQAVDVVTSSGSGVVVTPTVTSLSSLDDAAGRYAPTVTSPALKAAETLAGVVTDFFGAARSASAPTMGAIENP